MKCTQALGFLTRRCPAMDIDAIQGWAPDRLDLSPSSQQGARRAQLLPAIGLPGQREVPAAPAWRL